MTSSSLTSLSPPSPALLSSQMFLAHRGKLTSHFGDGDLLLFVGGEVKQRNADTDLLFRQESEFLYLTGIDLPGYSLLITVEANGTTKSTLFIPDEDLAYRVWHGTPRTPAYWKEKTGVDLVLYQKSLLETVRSANPSPKHFYLKGSRKSLEAPTAVGGEPEGEGVIVKPFTEGELDALLEDASMPLKAALDVSRATKTEYEIAIMKETSRISGEAHAELMRHTAPGVNEYQLEAIFRHYCSVRGCRHQAYIPIVGSGPNGAILHYNDNNRLIEGNDMVLVDAGCEWNGYASDITRTWPTSGIFSEDQRRVYEMVLELQKELIAQVVSGSDYNDLRANCSLLLTTKLIERQFLIGISAEEALEKRLATKFMPHGLGHLVGLDVHDCTIYPATPLEPGMCVTIEPGVYFNPYLLDPVLESEDASYFNKELLEKYRNFGGVRIEDVVLVTETGPEVLTTSAPKEIAEIESLMKAAQEK